MMSALLELVTANPAATVATLAVGAFALLQLMPTLLAVKRPPAKDTPQKGNVKDKIVLFTAPKGPGVATVSPFDLKLQAFLKLAGIPYETVSGSPLRGPKGRVPYIQHGPNLIGDSQLIINYLTATYGPTLTNSKVALWDQLTPEAKAKSTAVTRIVEDSIYHPFVFYRWLTTDHNWSTVRQYVLGPDVAVNAAPSFLHPTIHALARGGVVGGLKANGLISHSDKDIFGFAVRDLEALEGLLGSEDFFGGKSPCEGDCAVYGILENTLTPPWESPLKEEIKKREKLVAFVDRMRALAFPELVESALKIRSSGK